MPTSVNAVQAGLETHNLTIVGVIAILTLAALGLGLYFRSQVLKADAGSPKMQEIAGAVEEGAKAYLNRQFRTLALFVLLVFALLFLLPGDTGVRLGRSIAFIIGAGFSAVIGSVGMRLAVKANVRVAAAAGGKNGYAAGAKVAFRTGGTVGLFTVGLGLLGATSAVLIFRAEAPGVLEGFGFGAALLAMFMRVGGGIFTKAADVGADLVGKVEQGIPEDDPRNPATIADNVGDNVGDCAGMAADLFESYAVTLVASLILGKAAFGEQGLVFPLLIASIGMITAAVGVYLTKMRPGENGLVAINRGFYISALIGAVLSVVASYVYLPDSFSKISFVSVGLQSPYMYTNANGVQTALISGDPRMLSSIAVIVGIVLAGIILWLTGYFTGTDKPPTMKVARTSRTGAATVVLAGIGVGFESAVYTAVAIGAAVAFLFALSGGLLSLGLFFLAIAGCGLLTTVGVIVAMDTFGPVSDNAQGIAEMSGEASEEAAEILTGLDAVGNTTKAITKGIAIATAVLAAAALFGSYRDAVSTALGEVTAEALGSASVLTQTALNNFQIFTPTNLFGLILGGAVVFLFSGLATDAVTRAAGSIVYEVRRQFRDNPGIMTYDTKPNYAACVDICTKDSLRELVTPGLLAAMAPIAVGFGLGPGPLAGFLAGSIVTGVLMAVFLSNAGGSWDNAKKIVEDGAYGGKGSDAHAATVIGDTVGDPFKDTAGPAINPLIKVMNLVALLIVPTVVTLSVGENENTGGRILIAILALVVIIGAVLSSKLRRSSMDEDFEDDDLVDETDEDIEGGGDPSVALISVEDDPATQVAGSNPRDLFSNTSSSKSRAEDGAPTFEASDAPVSAFTSGGEHAGADLPGERSTARVVPVPVGHGGNAVGAKDSASVTAGEESASEDRGTDAAGVEDSPAEEAGVDTSTAADEVAGDGSAESDAQGDTSQTWQSSTTPSWLAAEQSAEDDSAATPVGADATAADAGAGASEESTDHSVAGFAAEPDTQADGAPLPEAEAVHSADSEDADDAEADGSGATDSSGLANSSGATGSDESDAQGDTLQAWQSSTTPSWLAAEQPAEDDSAATVPGAGETAAADDAGAVAAEEPTDHSAAGFAADSDTQIDGAAEQGADSADAVAGADSADADSSEAPHGPGSALPLSDGGAPAGYTIKGNADSMKFHTPASPYYGRTKAEVWFRTEEAAISAGYVNAVAARPKANDQAAAEAAEVERVAAEKAAAEAAEVERVAAEKAAAEAAEAERAATLPAASFASGQGRDSTKTRATSEGASAQAAGEGPHGPDSALPLSNGKGPEGFTIKGNTNSMKYHTTESPYYKRTKAEVWFRTEAAAAAAGYENAGGSRGFAFEAGPYPNSAKPAADGSGPEGYPIKANEDSMKFHGPDSPWYVRTKAEYWFKSEEDARAAGYKKPGE